MDLRRGECQQPRRFRLVPQPIADARPGSASTAAALIGGCARDAHGFEPRHAGARFVTRHALLAAVDDDAHAVDRDRGLRDCCRQHDPAAAIARRPDRLALDGAIEAAMQLDHIECGCGEPVRQALARAADLCLPGKKSQQRAGFLAHRAGYGVGHLLVGALCGIAAEIARFDRECAAQRLDHRRIAEETCHARGVERRRHDDDAQILAQSRLRIERQGQAEIGVERALVELVEEDGANAGQRGIVEDEARENALGDHFDARFRSDARIEAGADADGFADLLAGQLRHAFGRGAGGQAARLQQQDLGAPEPRRIEQCRRHARRLAGAGWRHEHGRSARGERLPQLLQHLVDG